MVPLILMQSIGEAFMPRMQPATIFLLSLLTCLLPELAVYAQNHSNQPVATNSSTKQQASLPLDEVRTFVNVFERIKSSYIEPIDDKTLMDNAIKGMVSNLDPHSVYLDSKSYHALEDMTNGQYGGLGIEIEQKEGFIRIITPLDDSPAAKAGIQAGDIIVKINDIPTKDMSLDDAGNKLAGKIGEKINLTIVRQLSDPFIVTITRAKVQVPSVKSQLLEKNYGYLRIAQFQHNTGKEVSKGLAQLNQQNGSKLKGIVLDLRNNPGGILQEAVTTVNQFVSKGLIVYTKGRMANSETRFYADIGDPSLGIPMVVLINNGSASAAEIVAGALQDLKRAVIMGTTSFGKGSVQTVLPINKTEALKLTTALYYTPNGRSIQAQGIVPDIMVEQATISKNQKQFEVREADLQNHLNNSTGKERPSSKVKAAQIKIQDEDYQLSQAIALLKGLNVVNTKTSPLKTEQHN